MSRRAEYGCAAPRRVGGHANGEVTHHLADQVAIALHLHLHPSDKRLIAHGPIISQPRSSPPHRHPSFPLRGPAALTLRGGCHRGRGAHPHGPAGLRGGRGCGRGLNRSQRERRVRSMRLVCLLAAHSTPGGRRCAWSLVPSSTCPPLSLYGRPPRSLSQLLARRPSIRCAVRLHSPYHLSRFSAPPAPPVQPRVDLPLGLTVAVFLAPLAGLAAGLEAAPLLKNACKQPRRRGARGDEDHLRNERTPGGRSGAQRGGKQQPPPS